MLQIANRVGGAQKVGDPSKEGSQLGPLVNDVQFERVQGWIQKGIEEGAQLICGGTGKPENCSAGYFVKPTVFSVESNQSVVAQQEIFGPVLVILPFDSEDEAIEIANDSPYGLAAYIQTGNNDRAERVASQLRAGAIYINGGQHQFGSPFGGYKQSGNGREGGIYGLEDFQEIKTLHFG